MQQIRVSCETTADIGAEIVRAAVRLPIGETAMLAVFDKWSRFRGSVTVSHVEIDHYTATGAIARPGSDRDGAIIDLAWSGPAGPAIGQSFEPDPSAPEAFYADGPVWTRLTAPAVKVRPASNAARSLARRAAEAWAAWEGRAAF